MCCNVWISSQKARQPASHRQHWKQNLNPNTRRILQSRYITVSCCRASVCCRGPPLQRPIHLLPQMLLLSCKAGARPSAALAQRTYRRHSCAQRAIRQRQESSNSREGTAHRLHLPEFIHGGDRQSPFRWSR